MFHHEVDNGNCWCRFFVQLIHLKIETCCLLYPTCQLWFSARLISFLENSLIKTVSGDFILSARKTFGLRTCKDHELNLNTYLLDTHQPLEEKQKWFLETLVHFRRSLFICFTGLLKA